MILDSVEYHIEVMHEKGILRLVRLVPKEPGHDVRFGVIKGNELKMTGTKAEAKQYYGTWRSGR